MKWLKTILIGVILMAVCVSATVYEDNSEVEFAGGNLTNITVNGTSIRLGESKLGIQFNNSVGNLFDKGS